MLNVATIRKLNDLAERLRERHEEDDARLLEGVVEEMLEQAEGDRVLAREYLTTGQAARQIGVSLQTIKNWAASGKLPAEQIGGRFYVPRQAVRAYLDQLRARRPERVSQPARKMDPAIKTLVRLVGRLPASKLARYESLAEKQAAKQPLSEAEEAEMAALLDELVQTAAHASAAKHTPDTAPPE